MKLHSIQCFTIVMFIVCLFSGVVNSQMPTDSTPTPPIQRLHYGYEHIPPVNATEHDDILFFVFVDDAQPGDEMRIHFRKKGKKGFHAVTMGYNPAEHRFEALIDERYHGNKSLEYYIEIFPVQLPPIRIPEVAGQFNSVKLKKKISRYIEPLLLVIIISAPFVGVFAFSKARKGHAQKRAEYERRVRSRRRKLSKEREKHYKEYLKTLSSGTRGTTNGSDQSTQSRLKRPTGTPRSQSKPASRKPLPRQVDNKEVPAGPQLAADKSDDQKQLATKGFGPHISTDEELRRELDNILNKTDAETVLLNRKQEVIPPVNTERKQEPKTSTRPKPTVSSPDNDDLSDDEKQDLLDLFDI